MILTPIDQYKDSEGKVTDTLDNAEQVRDLPGPPGEGRHRRRRTGQQGQAAAVGHHPARPQRLPFEKTYAIMRACRGAGY